MIAATNPGRAAGKEMKPISVLFVDDNAVFLSIVTRFMDEHHAKDLTLLATARNGEEAVALAREQRPEAVVMDLTMPGVSGLELIARLRSAAPLTGIVVLTLNEARWYKEAAVAAGADEFVSKQTLGLRLVDAIRGATRSRRGFPLESLPEEPRSPEPYSPSRSSTGERASGA